MSRLARTPENFPKMKHRAAARQAKKEVDALLAFVEQMPKITEMVFEWATILNERITAALKAIEKAAQEASQKDFALVADGEA